MPTQPLSLLPYPGSALRLGDSRAADVTAVQTRLNEVGCGPLTADGAFAGATESAVKLYQTRRGIVADGIVGPLTWADLAQQPVDTRDAAPTPLLQTTLQVARSQNGVRETKGQPNRGPQVDQYVASVGLNPNGAYSWCQAFVYWSFNQAAQQLGVTNPCVKTPGVLEHWNLAPPQCRVPTQAAFDNPSLVRPGAVFIIDHGHGLGHAGLVVTVGAGDVGTIEGNTNEAGSREGDGVYQKSRSIASITLGFIDYGLAGTGQ